MRVKVLPLINLVSRNRARVKPPALPQCGLSGIHLRPGISEVR
jgi:hypothetical protein